VGVLLTAPLTAFELAQASFGRLRCDLLECLTTPGIPLAATFDLAPRKRLTIAVGRQSDDTEINTQHALGVNRFRCFNFAGDEQISLTRNEPENTPPLVARTHL